MTISAAARATALFQEVGRDGQSQAGIFFAAVGLLIGQTSAVAQTTPYLPHNEPADDFYVCPHSLKTNAADVAALAIQSNGLENHAAAFTSVRRRLDTRSFVCSATLFLHNIGTGDGVPPSGLHHFGGYGRGHV